MDMEANKKLGKKCARALKIVIFLTVAAVVFCGINILVRPYWNEHYDSESGFYEEPKNTIETLFLGSSIMGDDVSPMELYENYGICAYNLGMESQPVMASYFWLEEVYNRHSETLDTVVLDVSMLRRDPGEAWYVKSTEYMRLSKAKLHFLKAYYEDDPLAALDNLIPVLSYHENWKSLTLTDFSKEDVDPNLCLRGYRWRINSVLQTGSSYTDISVPLYVVEDEAEDEVDETALLYLQKMKSFCDRHDIKLVLTKTPHLGDTAWSDESHNMVQAIADEYQLDFIDFNYLPYIDELDFNFAAETYDSTHMNYYGVVKFTEWWGKYLTEECGNRDIRGEESYAFMEDELEDYHRYVMDGAMDYITDPAEYLSDVMDKDDYAIFISVKDEASDALTDEQREVFASLGLDDLSTLGFRDSYLAVIDDGKVREIMQQYDSENGEQQPISLDGTLDDQTEYSLVSGGYNAGATTSIVINGSEYSAGTRGINIAIYDERLQEVVDTAVFDTYTASIRKSPYYVLAMEDALASGKTPAELTGALQQLYKYNRECDGIKTAKILRRDEGETGLIFWLQAFMDGSYDIYISSKGDAGSALTDDVRNVLADMGFGELAKLDGDASYVAVIRDGEVILEETALGGMEISTSAETYTLVSNGGENGSSIMISGTEYSPQKKGLNIVIYDNVLGRVIDSVSFNTGEVGQAVP